MKKLHCATIAGLVALWSPSISAIDHAAIAREAMARFNAFLSSKEIGKGKSSDTIGFDRSDAKGDLVLFDVDTYTRIIVYAVMYDVGVSIRHRSYINAGCVMTLNYDVLEYWIGDKTFERTFIHKS